MTEESQRQTQETFGRILEMCGEVPSPFEKCGLDPAFLQDLYLNFKRYVWNDSYLDPRGKAVIAFAVSFHRRCPEWSEFFAARMKKLGFSQESVDQVRGVVSTCTAFNTMFKFDDLSGNKVLTASLGLRGHSLNAPLIGPLLIELIAVVISTLNSCGNCTAGHVREARGRGASDDMILDAVKCAATVNAGCTFLS